MSVKISFIHYIKYTRGMLPIIFKEFEVFFFFFYYHCQFVNFSFSLLSPLPLGFYGPEFLVWSCITFSIIFEIKSKNKTVTAQKAYLISIVDQYCRSSKPVIRNIYYYYQDYITKKVEYTQQTTQSLLICPWFSKRYIYILSTYCIVQPYSSYGFQW